jgi:threonine dehydrogenase-like Zn-dependent dehydrogenase
MCRTGRANHCLYKSSTEAGVSCDGAFAPYYCAEARSLHRLADTVGFDEAVLVEPLSCALTGVSRLRLRPDLIAVVIGGGPMGVLCAYALSIAGLQGAIVERSEHRRVATVGAVPSGFSVHESLAGAIVAVGWQGACDVVVDTTGTQAQEALSVLAPGGQVLAIGLGRGQATIDPARMADRSISLIGSIDSLGTFAAAAHLVTCGRVPAPRILSASFPLADFKSALADLGCHLDRQVRGVPGRALKLVLHP